MNIPLPVLTPNQYGITAAEPDVFDHQVSGTYEECQRMALYRHVWGRITKGEGYSLLWGRVFHKVVEVWLKTENLDQVISVIEVNIPDNVEDRYGRDQRRMQEGFVEWVRYNKDNPIELIAAEQAASILCNEPCVYSPTGCDLQYGGRMDRVVRWNSLVGPLDIKTTVQELTDPIAEFKPDHQIAGYIWMASHLLGKHCWGAIIEQVVMNKSNLKVRRFPIPYTKDNIWEWAQTERLRQAEFRQKVKDHPYDELQWRQNFGRCQKPFPCAYRDICLAPRDFGFRYKWLRDNTDEIRWNFNAPPEEEASPTVLVAK